MSRKGGGTMVSPNPDALPQSDRAPTDKTDSAAERSLAEAAERRRVADSLPQVAEESGGRGGLEPVRFGDWEVNGLASDF